MRDKNKNAARRKLTQNARLSLEQLKLLPQGRLLPGRKALLDVLRHRASSIESIILADGLNLQNELSCEFESFAEQSPPIFYCDKQDLTSAFTDFNCQGVLAVLKKVSSLDLKYLISKAKAPGAAGLILALDEINDPHNLGSIFRAAEASGADGIILTARRSAQITAAVRKVSAGASELLATSSVTNLARALSQLKENGFWVVGTALESRAVDLYKADLPFPVVLVLGSEGEGLRKLTKELCDVLVQIPMEGQIQSLNVGQAAAVVLFELLRRRKG